MKTARTCTLIGILAVAVFAASPTVAGAQGTPQLLPGQESIPTPTAQSAPVQPVADGNGTASGSASNNVAFDNGLWDGASIGEGCSLCGGGSCNPPDWYTEQGVRFFGRSKPRHMALGYLETVIGSTDEGISEKFSDRSAAPNMSVAYEMTLGHYFARDTLNRDHFVEFSFWGLNRFRDVASVTSTQRLTQSSGDNTITAGNLYSPYAVFKTSSLLGGTLALTGTLVPGFDEVEKYTTYYSSYTNNFEINGRIVPRGEDDQVVLHPDGKWRRECRPGRYISYLYGLRFMKIDETFRFHGLGLTETHDSSGTLIDSVVNSGEYDVCTHNNLLGLQIGADMMFRECRWSWGLRAKVGPYVNFADQVSNVAAGVDGETPDFSQHLSSARHVAALIGEVGLTATYKFRPNLVGRASYDMMWVTGLALAPEQLQFAVSPVNQINTNGTAVMHGPSLGLEWLW
ncbi:MAG: BBP7 family outer membrane beta-barrel protein [Thermoguttaceae bacterium]